MDLTPKSRCEGSLEVFIESYLQLVEEFPNDLSKIISEFRECKIREGSIMNQIELLVQRISLSDNKTDELRKIETLLQDKFKISDEKLEIADKIKTLIHERLEEFEERNRPSIEEHKLKLQPCTALCSTPIAPPEKVKKKRGRKPKKKILDDSTTSITADTTPCSLMLLATTAVDVELNAAPIKKVCPKKSSALKDPIMKRPRKTRKRRQFKKKSETDPESDEPESDNQKNVDEIEPVYCICRQVSFGQMIECEYESCSLEWFHFKCVGLKQVPKGKWYCPKCRGKKSNVISNLKRGLIA